jgi:peptidoglycan/xylan/chitin deacetylase (PgdA/CDA1 family)
LNNQILEKLKNYIYNFLRYLYLKEKLDFPEKVAIYFHYVEEHNFETIHQIVKYFLDIGYKLVKPSDFLISSDEKLLFISFDDNYGSWVRLADFLSVNNIYSTFYINSGLIKEFSTDEKRLDYFKRIKHMHNDCSVLEMSDIIKIRNFGHNIGGHSSDHYPLTMIELKDAFEQIYLDKIRLEHILNESVVDFSYPYGMPIYFNNVLRDYCLSIGYKSIAKAIPCMLYKKEKNEFIVNRTNWRFDENVVHNLNNLRINAKTFIGLVGKSPIG